MEAPPPVEIQLDLVGQAELVDSCDRVTTADDRGAVSLGEGLGDSLGAVSEVVNSKTPMGPFQKTVLAP